MHVFWQLEIESQPNFTLIRKLYDAFCLTEDHSIDSTLRRATDDRQTLELANFLPVLAESGSLELVCLLLEKERNVQDIRQFADYNFIFRQAVLHEKIAAVEYLLHLAGLRKWDQDQTLSNNDTENGIAIDAKSFIVLDPDSEVFQGRAPLSPIASLGNMTIAKMLLEVDKIDLNSVDGRTQFPISNAIT